MSRPEYPSDLETVVRGTDGTAVRIRPIRPSDARMEQDFVRGLSAETRYFRFMDSLAELSPRMLERFTNIDYDREVALVALAGSGNAETEVGVARYVKEPDGRSCEFAIVIADDWQTRGIGRQLMVRLIDSARDRGLEEMFGLVLASNGRMLRFCDRLGFTRERFPEDPHLVLVRMVLAGRHGEGSGNRPNSV